MPRTIIQELLFAARSHDEAGRIIYTEEALEEVCDKMNVFLLEQVMHTADIAEPHIYFGMVDLINQMKLFFSHQTDIS